MTIEIAQEILQGLLQIFLLPLPLFYVLTLATRWIKNHVL